MGQLTAQRMLPTTGGPSSSSEAADQLPSLSSCRSGETLTVAVIDPRSLTREGLMRLLDRSERLELIPVSRGSELLGKGRDVLSRVQIVLLNLGSAAIRDPEIVGDIALLNETLPDSAIIVICDREDAHHIGEALRHGIRGYIPSNMTSRILMGALRLVQAGGTFAPADALTEALSRQSAAVEPGIAEDAATDRCRLTPRQLQILDLLRQGKPNKVIARELDLREGTVKVHVRQILRKMRVSNRTELAFLVSNSLQGKRA